MKNREKLANMSLYDMLMMLNTNIEGSKYCIIWAILGDYDKSLKICNELGKTGGCASCVQAFLNEKYDGRW